MTEVKKPVFTLLSIDLLDHGYKKLAELPDMIETVIEDDSLRYVKLGFQLDTAVIPEFNGSAGRHVRDNLVSAMAARLLDVVPERYNEQTGKRIILGADVATAMAEKLYRRAAMGSSSTIHTNNGRVWYGRVQIKPGVDVWFSPDFRSPALVRKSDMAGGEAMFGSEHVLWRVNTCVGDVTNYFDDVEFRRMWLENVQKAFPFMKLDTVDFKVYR